jgi:hypothetical protein
VDEAASQSARDRAAAGVTQYERRSRLARANDAVLIAVLVVPQFVWLAVVVYLLHRHA